MSIKKPVKKNKLICKVGKISIYTNNRQFITEDGNHTYFFSDLLKLVYYLQNNVLMEEVQEAKSINDLIKASEKSNKFIKDFVNDLIIAAQYEGQFGEDPKEYGEDWCLKEALKLRSFKE